MASVAVALLACELALRAAPDENVQTTSTLGLFAPDPELRWVLKPDLRVIRDWAGRPIVIRTDHDGHRIADRDSASVPHDPIAFGGDSYVFGNEVNAEETFVHLVGRAMGTERAAINVGVGGYSLTQECLALRRYLHAQAPIRHAVLVVYVGNDVEWGADSGQTIGVDDDGLLSYRPQSPWGKAGYFLLRHSKLAFRVHVASQLSWIGRLHPFSSKSRPYRWIYDPRAFTLDRIADHRRVVATLRDDACAAHVPLTVVLMPEEEQVYGSLGDLPNQMLGAMVSSLGVPVIDLLPAMRRAAPTGPPLYNQVTAGHLSPTGHRLVARVLIHHLIRPAARSALAPRFRPGSS